MFRLIIATSVLLVGCGEPDSPGYQGECVAGVEPVWIAGSEGDRAEVGKFGRADAVILDPNGLLLVGDESEEYQELKVFDVNAENPGEYNDPLPSVADVGADPGPGGSGELEFRNISGFAIHPTTGEIFVVEQANRRVQILRWSSEPRSDTPFEFVRFWGGGAVDLDNPEDGEFVRLQAANFDSAGRLYISDDAKGYALNARRDIQVFDEDLEFITTIGDSSYGSAAEGNLEEPENFVFDEGRDRIYVADEGTNDIAIFKYSDYSFVERFGAFEGDPNGVVLDQAGVIYVIDQDTSRIDFFDPETLEPVGCFGRNTAPDDLTPSTFNSPDTLALDLDADLFIVVDQGHHRVQGFSLSELQAAAGLATNP